MLEGAEESSYSSIVSWNTDGRSFTIHDSEALMQQVVPLYFQQTHFRSFVSKKFHLLSFCAALPAHNFGVYISFSLILLLTGTSTKPVGLRKMWSTGMVS